MRSSTVRLPWVRRRIWCWATTRLASVIARCGETSASPSNTGHASDAYARGVALVYPLDHEGESYDVNEDGSISPNSGIVIDDDQQPPMGAIK